MRPRPSRRPVRLQHTGATARDHQVRAGCQWSKGYWRGIAGSLTDRQSPAQLSPPSGIAQSGATRTRPASSPTDHLDLGTRTPVRYYQTMDYELEQLRRSMLSPGARALDREGALRVLGDLQVAQRERDELRARLDERSGPFA